MSFFNNPNRIPESYGLRIAAGLIGFFLVMKLAGFSHIVELRVLNLFILMGGVYMALKRFKESHNGEMDYLRGMITGIATSSIGSAAFALFLFIYMQVDAEMMQFIMENEPMGMYLNPYIASFIVGFEGVFSGLLVTFMLMNYLNTKETNQP